MTIAPYRDAHYGAVDALWRAAFPDDPPWNRADLAIPAKLAVQPDLLLVALDGDDVIGTVLAGYDGHRGWLYAVAVRAASRREGVGTRLIEAAEARLRALGCGKINLQVRATNEAVVRFYESLGYAVEDRISLGKRIAG